MSAQNNEAQAAFEAVMQATPISDVLTGADENVELQREIDVLAAMPLLRYEREYKEAAKRLGMRASVLDGLVKAAKSGESNNATIFQDIEPWPSPVDPAVLLSEMSEGFRRYAVLPEYADIALTLWCVFTWFCEASHIAPLLVIRSPEKGCGKSTVMSIVKRLVYRPLMLSGLSTAVLFRVVDKYHPTMLIDEGDTFLNNENEELHGVINSGYSQAAPYHWRCVGDNHEPKPFNVFSPKAIAFIGHTRETLHDRAVEVELRRKLQDEKVARLRHSDGGELDILARKLARLAADHIGDYRNQCPILPESLPDRQADNWEPLMQVAMLAGEEWVQRANKAALALTGSKAENTPISMGVELLADIQKILQDRDSTRIRSIKLVEILCADEEAGWATYNRGKPITPRQISKRLAEFGIHPRTLRFLSEGLQKGYDIDCFEDAFARYLTSPDSTVTQLQPCNSEAINVTDGNNVTVTLLDGVMPNTCIDKGCNRVTDVKIISGEAEFSLPICPETCPKISEG